VGAEYYPDHLLPLVGQLEVVDVRFAALRERVLVDYGRNTARAYGVISTMCSGGPNDATRTCWL